MAGKSNIELAPDFKRSLALANPLILASGAMDTANVGAVVTVPLSLRARGGTLHARVAELPGGLLMRTGAANPGLVRYVRDHERIWAAGHTPIIVAFAAQAARDWEQMAAQLEHVPGVGGIELHLNPTIRAGEAIRATRLATEFPILAKIELEDALQVSPECVKAGANAIVVGRAPRGMAMVSGNKWFGRLYSPTVRPIALRALAEVAALNLGVPLVGSGGVYSADDIGEFLSIGAIAVEIDSAQWLDPNIINDLVSRYA